MEEQTFDFTKEQLRKLISRSYYEGCIDGSKETYFNRRGGTTGAMKSGEEYADEIIEGLEGD
jgi:hypothetical protein